MADFALKIVTPDGIRFDGRAEQLTVRTIEGDVGLLAGHINYVAPLGMGQAVIVTGGKRRVGACIGGMVSMVNGEATLLPSSFEWADMIDVDRAEASLRKADQILKDKNSSATDLKMAEARIRRALVRKSVAGSK